MIKLKAALDTLRRIRVRARSVIGTDVFCSPDIHTPAVSLGEGNGVWTVLPVPPQSIVYSFGVGDNLSFEQELVSRFGASVFAFDPTPRANDWIARQELDRRIVFQPVAISSQDGEETFFPPTDDEHVSFSTTLNPDVADDDGVTLPVRRLATLVRENGHLTLDVLKLDIEGSEYRVIPDVLSSGVEIRQLLVEFHHRGSKSRVRQTKSAIQLVRSAGYRLFHVSPGGTDYSFVRSL